MCAPALADAAPLFTAPYLTNDSGPGRFVAVGDLNGDLAPDAVVACDSPSGITVLIGRGDGTFEPRADYAMGNQPFCVAIGDLNGDQKPDVVTANWMGGSVGVRLGVGDGTFGPLVEIPMGLSSQPVGVALADCDADQVLDLLVANTGFHTVSWLKGLGNGSFAPKVDFATGNGPAKVVVADFNGDQKPDLAVSNAANGLNSSVSILLGDGNGGFGPKTDFATVIYAGGLATGDLDGDGDLDLAVTGSCSPCHKISVLIGHGDGTFEPKVDYDTDVSPGMVAFADFDDDGDLDIVTANWGPGSASVLLGVGDGTFTAGSTYTNGWSCFGVAVGDMDQDDRADFVLTNQFVGTWIYLGNGNGTFGALVQLPAPTRTSAVSLADLNADGELDLAVTGFTANTLSVRFGTGSGSFGASTDYATGVGPKSLAIADLDGDDAPDAVVANLSDDDVSVLLGSGDGSLGAKADFATGVGPVSVAVAYLNADDAPDLVVADTLDHVSVLLGNGDGSFSASVNYPAGSRPNGVAVGDVNGDTHADVVVSNGMSNTVSVLLGAGDGSLGPKTDFAAGSRPSGVALGDLDEDGDPDIVVTNQFTRTASVLLGIGDGTFAAPTAHSSAYQFPLLADLNGDDDLDLVAAGLRDVSVFLGNGDGTLAPKTGYGAGRAPTAIAAGDLNGDGRPDLAVADNVDNRVTLHFNTLGAPVVDVPEPASPGAALWLAVRPVPARAGVTIRFRLPSGGDATLRVHDLAGRLVKTIARGPLPPGEHKVGWDRKSDAGTPARPGVYFVELATATARVVRRTVLVQ
jgi:hypothetical protein